VSEYDRLGYSASEIGDFNGDGLDDIIIGAARADAGAGVSYIAFGAARPIDTPIELSELDGSDGFSLSGVTENDQAGFIVSPAGDVNGDGFDDLIIVAHPADGYAGEAYVVFGKADGFDANIDLANLDGVDGFRLVGIDGGDNAGHGVSGAGDVNGDGFDDLLIGAPGADPNGVDGASESYVVYGDNFTNAVTHLGDEAANTLTGTDGADNMNGAQGDDSLNGQGGDDRLTGAHGDDTFAFADGDGNETITDFQAGAATDDRIYLSGHSAANGFGGIVAIQVGDDTVIDLGADSITLLGVDANGLRQDDFAF
jgi:Ca2+-binding RTX toxin-like protein